jgi:DHA1 family multidrug resistance protein-like MFS transporter
MVVLSRGAAPVLASLASGFIVSNPKLGWRWTEWITLILSSFAWLVTVLFLPETHLPRLLAWKAAALRRETGDQRYRAKKPDHEGTWDKAKKVALLPATFFFTEPVITVLGSYLVLLYVLLFTFLSGFAFVFQDTYHLSASHTSACFGSIAAGATLFATCAPLFYSAARRRVERSRGAPVEPEFRLWPAMVTSPLLPVLLFWLGWTNAERISIWSGLGACFLFGVVLIALYVSSYEYIVDSYGDHAASALASVTMVRYLIAGGMVVAARPMYEGIGVQYTLTLLGCCFGGLARSYGSGAHMPRPREAHVPQTRMP